MQTVYCDVCKKKMENPVTNRSFYYLAEYSLCEPCKDGLEYQIKPTVRGKEPFSLEWYRKLVLDSLGKAVQKGKI